MIGVMIGVRNPHIASCLRSRWGAALAVVVVGLGVLFVSGCGPKSSPKAPITRATNPVTPPVTAPVTPATTPGAVSTASLNPQPDRVHFTEITAEAGIHFSHFS